MKIKEIQEYKQVDESVDSNLSLLNELITELNSIIADDEYDADSVAQTCNSIAELAKAIANGTHNIYSDCE